MIPAPSLFQRVTLGLLIPLLIGGIALLATAYESAERTANENLDRLLDAATRAMAEQLRWQTDRLWFDVPASALDTLAPSGDERVFYSLIGPDGTLVSGNAHLPAPPNHSDDAFKADTIAWNGMTIRLGQRTVIPSGWTTPPRFDLRVAHTLEARRALTQELFQGSALRILGLLVLASVSIVVIVRRALHPLRQLRYALRRRSSEDLAPLTPPPTRELKELTGALNELLARLRAMHAEQQRFIGDASHQLRTPLSGLSAHAELALRETDPAKWREALERLHDSSRQAARLASQLLSYTRLNHPDALEDATTLALNACAQTAVSGAFARPEVRRIDLGLALCSPSPQIVGSEWALAEALANLLDNALHVGATHITVGTLDAPPRLWVEDNGPGIDHSLSDDLTRPFQRGTSAYPGSGLGLAIVSGIARAHKATLDFDRPEQHQGLRITLTFAFNEVAHETD
ncbi:sensor histidine kinase [Larsenimonas suaedae]|uniref:histidine kinase n=1 Tax=Larsenimonas suaedae TaxID=1851019 RepID=A0ABU1GXW9_9GAMM|nr:sensor histidine kinase [Larsenimonas suaedae]MCM2972780.1 sensor histidine kinase N-terminal domain-containing protein [Larsenimonas suaedae]MDR5896879.1 sensor histidine kinase N-terminal domain-containing protein [Larsenimonas suaedae]